MTCSTRTMPARGSRRSRDERGSVSLWAVLLAPTMIVLAGLVVDGAGQVHARQHATHLAAEAARAGGQHLQTGDAIRGLGATPDTARAAAAARAFLAGAGLTGTVTVRGGDTVRVQVADSYPTVFLTLIGIDRLDVHATAEARTIRALNGEQR